MSELITTESYIEIRETSYLHFLRVFFAGLLLPLGFAPFHFPGLAILSITLLFLHLKPMSMKKSFLTGLTYGVGFFGLGVSWIYVSIHEYGHLHSLVAGFITLIFIAYLALYFGFLTVCYNRLTRYGSAFWHALVFCALWCVSEYLRSLIIGGFPWLLLGFGQIDSPLQHLLPFIGVLGVSFVTCFAACILGLAMQAKHTAKYLYLMLFIGLILSPLIWKNKQWTTLEDKNISVGIIQANLSMRDKWNEHIFWTLLDYYQQKINQLLSKKQLIVLPESAIPLPSHYLSDFLESLDFTAKQEKSAILLGIPHAEDHQNYYNTLLALGNAEGRYYKQHLVAFGEFVPSFLSFLTGWLGLPANLEQGPSRQSLMSIQQHPIASLICYELAFPELLRQQLPEAQWIVSVSDDGWFGHSLAVFQHLQMAQVLSKLTGRYQIVSNNDGLSAIIQSNGDIVDVLPAFTQGVLESSLYPANGSTPWVKTGDKPIYGLLVLILLLTFIREKLLKKTLL